MFVKYGKKLCSTQLLQLRVNSRQRSTRSFPCAVSEAFRNAFVQPHLFLIDALQAAGKGGAAGQSLPPFLPPPNVSCCSKPGEHGPDQLAPLGG